MSDSRTFLEAFAHIKQTDSFKQVQEENRQLQSDPSHQAEIQRAKEAIAKANQKAQAAQEAQAKKQETNRKALQLQANLQLSRQRKSNERIISERDRTRAMVGQSLFSQAGQESSSQQAQSATAPATGSSTGPAAAGSSSTSSHLRPAGLAPDQTATKKRGRPKGSKNLPKTDSDFPDDVSDSANEPEVGRQEMRQKERQRKNDDLKAKQHKTDNVLDERKCDNDTSLMDDHGDGGGDSTFESWEVEQQEEEGEEEASNASVYLEGVRQQCCLRNGLPPLFQIGPTLQGGLTTATFALPGKLYKTESMGTLKIKYNGQWVKTGCCCGTEDRSECFFFCSCSSATSNVKHILESTTPGEGYGEMEIESCLHITTLKTIIEEEGYDISNLINDLEQMANDWELDRDEEDGGSSSFVEDLGMIQMGRGKESVVWQVGLECSYGLPAAIVIETPSGTSQSLSDYTCVMCKSKNCNHLTGLMKHLDIPASSSDIDGKRSGSNSQAAQEAFEASYARLVEKPGESGTSEQQVTRLKICGLSRQRIPMISSAATAAIKMRRATSQWPKSDEPLCLGNYGASDCRIEVQGAVVIGCGGIVQGVTIYGTTEDPYDGCEDAILRTAKKGVLITHELVEEFLAQLYVGRVCMKAWFKAKTRVFLRAAQEMVDINATSMPEDTTTWSNLVDEARKLVILLQRPSLANDFINSVFDYITLLHLDYDDLFKCQCPTLGRCSDFTRLKVVYDNACNLLHSILLRYPALLQRDGYIIDPLHFHSHKSCSQAYNGKLHLCLKGLNTSINEQKNRFTNRARTSLSGMGQVRACIIMRHFISMINGAQRSVNTMMFQNQLLPTALPFKSVVCDGSKTSFAGKHCFMARPWLKRPVNSATETPPSHLFRGAELDQALMIHDKTLRSTLEVAIEGKYVPVATWGVLTSWILAKRPCLGPYLEAYVKLVAPPHGSKEPSDVRKLERSCDSNFLSVVRHWCSGAPEIVLVPAQTFEAVEDVIRNQSVSTSTSQVIGMHSPLLLRVINLSISHDVKDGKRVGVSRSLIDLLTCCLDKAQNGLKACGGLGDNSPQVLKQNGASQPWENCFIDPVDEFFRTGVWTSSQHPVIRILPRMRQDVLAARSNEQYKKSTERNEMALLEKLFSESDLMGSTCNKYKSKVRSLTAGLFTVYCGGCGICELFELLPEAESTITVFETFAHRAWTPQELSAYQVWKKGGVWTDPVPCEFYDSVL